MFLKERKMKIEYYNRQKSEKKRATLNTSWYFNFTPYKYETFK